jgi:NADH-quinone oxidoreductase subunit K
VLNPNLFPYLLGLSAFLFSVGAAGVLIRRNPLVVFMCIELMLNAANVALVAYGRFLNSEEGQVFAFMVIVVAAAEVVVGLALITRIFRLGRALDVDELNELSDLDEVQE